MDDAHCRVGLVDVLTAGTAGTHRLDLQIVHVDIKLFRFHLRRDQHRRCRRVDASLAFGLWYTLYAVAAGFKLQAAIHPIPADLAGNQRKAAGLAIVHLDRLHAPAFRLRVFRIHAVQIARKDIAFITAGRTADLQKGIVRIIGILGNQQDLQTGEQLFLLRLQFLDLHLRHLPKFLVVFAQQRLRLFQRLCGLLIFRICLHDLGQFCLLASQFGKLFIVRGDLRHHHQIGDLMIPVDHAFQPFDHHTHPIASFIFIFCLYTIPCTSFL